MNQEQALRFHWVSTHWEHVRNWAVDYGCMNWYREESGQVVFYTVGPLFPGGEVYECN